VPTLGARPVSAISRTDVRGLITRVLEAGAARNTARNVTAVLRSILNQAIEDQLLAVNPAARFGKLFGLRHDPRQHVVSLEAEDVARVLASFSAFSGKTSTGNAT
jgi:hypothetical protein